MNTFRRITVIIDYEWRRAIAKKWALGLIVLALAFQTLPFIIFSQFPEMFLTGEVKETMWVVGVLSGQSLFIQLIAILVAGGSMSEEYEQGTADVLLSKPISKLEYMTGKFLGGFFLVGLVESVTTVIGVILAYAFFGAQRAIYFVPIIFVAIVYSTLLFFSLSFMLSEILRRSTLAMLISFGTLVVSQIVGTILLQLYNVTQQQLYMDISRLLPTWSASTLPTSLASGLMTLPSGGFIPIPSGDVMLAAVIIAIYTAIFIAATTIRLVKSDVTKKTA